MVKTKIYSSETTAARWFSANESKAWGEKFFLVYSPIWMAFMGLTMAAGWVKVWGDVGFMFQACVVALPLFLYPLLFRKENTSITGTYWFKANVYIFVFSFFGNYVGSEYFFDVLGMVYHYPSIQWNFDTALVGTGEQKVPMIMYLLTHAYFMTYHTSAVVVLRRIKTSALPWMWLLFPVMLFVIGYFWAWAETKAMANPMIEEQFYYKDKARMLAYGSIMYACYFIASFPIFYFLDEDKNKRWSLWVVIAAGLSASMLTMYLLDFWTKYVGAIA